ncbi:trans-sulfuration enzyme family protein [Rubrivirga sp.]|uniref:trans-sulfuration enzyme family protein n=1 Tax=Rubrivirga sp. TaxID=1885344 RepID=UPI003B523F4A
MPDLRPETRLMHTGDRESPHGAVVPPLYQNSLFTFEDWDAIDAAFDDRTNAYLYSRLGNPTVRLAETKIAGLAGGERARLYASGMAAISAAALHGLSAGDHVVAVRNVYGPASTFFDGYLREKMGVTTTFVAGDDVGQFEHAMTERTALIVLESPSSAVFGLQDLAAVAALAKARGVRTMIDNTWATPLFQKPLAMGVDLEVHSCSKYLGGHSDLVGGVVIGSADDLTSISVRETELLGATMAPFEAWLLTRSLRTLPVRMRQHESSGLQVARFLEGHPRVRIVRHPGLDSHPQRALAERQMTGTTGLMGFALDTDDLAAIKRFVDGLRVFRIGVSWGGHESLVYAPVISMLKELSPERFAALGIVPGDVRISVGLEHPDDLVEDLDQALALARM